MADVHHSDRRQAARSRPAPSTERAATFSRELIGRESEVDALDAVLERLPAHGSVLVLRGEPGIGKSTLLGHVRDRAITLGAKTLSAAGVEAEAELAFAALHQLLFPVVGLASRLPDPQRKALDVAFGIGDDTAPDLFGVAMAAFRLVVEASSSGPLVLLVDDAQWIDRSSAGVLSFIARRLETVPIVMMLAARAGYPTWLEEFRLPTLDLERLSPSSAAVLLDRDAPDLHPITRARVLAEAAGNPLALVELARYLRTSHSTERLSPAPATLTARLEHAFAARLRGLPPDTRLALLAAALDSRASMKEVLDAASVVDGGPMASACLQHAVDAGLVEVAENGVLFHHPLIRSAVRQLAPPPKVLEMYAALADVVVDEERRLWHRASSIAGYDERIALALEDYAQSARRRGGVTSAGAALERAAALTVDPRSRARRLASAAEVAYELGLVAVVKRLLSEAGQRDDETDEPPRLAWLRQMISGDVWTEAGATKVFVSLAQRIQDEGDSDAALRSLVPIAHRCWWTRTRDSTRQFLIDAAMAMGASGDDPTVLAVIALANPTESARSVLGALSRIRLRDVSDPVAAMNVGIAAEKAGDFASGARFLDRAVAGLRAQVRLGPLTQALVHFAWASAHTAEWDAAAAAAHEAVGLGRDTSQPQYGLTAELVSAWIEGMRGPSDRVEAILAEPERRLLAMNGGPLLATAHLARGAAALGEGRHQEAFDHLWPVFVESASAFHRFMRWSAVLDLAEAASGSGRNGELQAVVSELEAIAARSNAPILRTGLTYAKPLLASDEDAGDLFAEALAANLESLPFLRARTLFSYGRWLRRRRRSADSRSPLRETIRVFDALGARCWADRARLELRATGETIGPRTPQARDRLTAQELEIARLAARGLSNRAIAERLSLSPRTIGGHLYRIFPKVGVSGRAQLRDVLEPADGKS